MDSFLLLKLFWRSWCDNFTLFSNFNQRSKQNKKKRRKKKDLVM